MPRPSKNTPLTQAEMIEAGKQKRATSSIYKAQADEVRDEAITQSIVNAMNQIKQADGKRKISLDDCDTVKNVAQAYLESCAVSSCFPSMSGFALCLGHTRQSLYTFMERKPDTETGQFLVQLHDLFSQVLAENSLRNNANSIVSIFLLKSLFGFKDTTTIEFPSNRRTDDITIDDLAVRAGLLND